MPFYETPCILNRANERWKMWC